MIQQNGLAKGSYHIISIMIVTIFTQLIAGPADIAACIMPFEPFILPFRIREPLPRQTATLSV
jgi:hypothetical protein